VYEEGEGEGEEPYNESGQYEDENAENNEDDNYGTPARNQNADQVYPDEVAEDEEEYYEEDEVDGFVEPSAASQSPRAQSVYSDSVASARNTPSQASAAGGYPSPSPGRGPTPVSTDNRSETTSRIQSLLARANQATSAVNSPFQSTMTTPSFDNNFASVTSAATTPSKSVQFAHSTTPQMVASIQQPSMTPQSGSVRAVATPPRESSGTPRALTVATPTHEPQTEDPSELRSPPRSKPSSSALSSPRSAAKAVLSPKPTEKKLTPSRSRSYTSFAEQLESRIGLDKAVEKGCLDLFGFELVQVDLPTFLPSQSLRSIRTLILRSNNIADLNGARLMHLTPALTELDLGNNRLSGSIPEDALPQTLERLDLSQNNLSDISTAVINCVQLHTLIVYSNLLKALPGLPPSLEVLDISDNLISNLSSLRAVASFSTKIHTLGIAGNPVFDSTEGLRARLTSMLPQLRVLDGETLPGSKVRKHGASANSGTAINPAVNMSTSSLPGKKGMSRQQQEVADARRMKEHEKQMQRLEAMQRRPRQPTISQDGVKDLLTRLMRPKVLPKYRVMVEQHSAQPQPTQRKRHPPKKAAVPQVMHSAEAVIQSAAHNQQQIIVPELSEGDLEALQIVDRWVERGVAEMGAAVLLLDEAFWMASGASLEPALVKRFSHSAKRISFVSERYKLAPDVEVALARVNEIGSLAKRGAIARTCTHMQCLGSILGDICSAFEFCNSYSLTMSDLRTSVEVTMRKPDGEYVIQNILPEFNIEFIPFSERVQERLDEESVASESRADDPIHVVGKPSAQSRSDPVTPSSVGDASPSKQGANNKLSYAEIDLYMDTLKSRLTAKAKMLVRKDQKASSLSGAVSNPIEKSIDSGVPPAPTIADSALDPVSTLTDERSSSNNVSADMVQVHPSKPPLSMSVAERLAHRLANRSTSAQAGSNPASGVNSNSNSRSCTPTNVIDTENLINDAVGVLTAAETNESDQRTTTPTLSEGETGADGVRSMKDRLLARLKKSDN
jgi:hypothetical protein